MKINKKLTATLTLLTLICSITFPLGSVTQAKTISNPITTVITKVINAVKTKITTTKYTYTVKKGDTLNTIAKKYGVTVDSIKKNNKLKTNTIKAGQRLTIIKTVTVKLPTPKPTTPTKPTTSTKPNGPDNPTTPPKSDWEKYCEQMRKTDPYNKAYYKSEQEWYNALPEHISNVDTLAKVTEPGWNFYFYENPETSERYYKKHIFLIEHNGQIDTSEGLKEIFNTPSSFNYNTYEPNSGLSDSVINEQYLQKIASGKLKEEYASDDGIFKLYPAENKDQEIANKRFKEVIKYVITNVNGEKTEVSDYNEWSYFDGILGKIVNMRTDLRHSNNFIAYLDLKSYETAKCYMMVFNEANTLVDIGVNNKVLKEKNGLYNQNELMKYIRDSISVAYGENIANSAVNFAYEVQGELIAGDEKKINQFVGYWVKDMDSENVRIVIKTTYPSDGFYIYILTKPYTTK